MAEEFSQSPENMVERADEFLDVAELPENAGFSIVARNGQGPSQPSAEVVIYPN